MELIDRYIYAVTRLQPEKQRDDIEKELRSLIDDMLAERTGDAEANNTDIEAVLNELGEPSVLASKYSGRPHYLIGPGLYGTYIKMLKIVPLAAAFGILIAVVADYAVTPPNNLGEAIGNTIGSIVTTAIEAFGWVTLIFALIERSMTENDKARWKKEWRPADLPEIPVKRALIKRSDPIVSITFIIIFCIFLNFNPGLFSIYLSNENIYNIPLLNLDVFRAYLPLINIGFAVSFIKEILKLIYGRYNLKLGLITIMLNSISFVLTLIVFSNYNIWNRNFDLLIETSTFHAANIVTIFASVVLGIIIFSFMVETLKIIYKMFQSGIPDIKSFINK